MRIGIDYRMLSAGTNTVNRGMGRYTQQQIREVLRLDRENEYLLFCRPGADMSLILPEIRAAPNVSTSTIRLSDEWLYGEANQHERALRYSEEYQDWIYRQQVDLYHATTPFLWHDTVLHRFDACPMVATFYDVIPLIFPDRYLQPGAHVTTLYGRALRFIQDSARLIAISQSAKRDASDYLGFPENRIDIAYPIADPSFRRLRPTEAQANIRRLRERCLIPEQFVLCVTYPHHSKNVETLLGAYALLAPTLRRQLPLVLTYVLSGNDREHMQRLTNQLGITDAVILTDLVSEEELVGLYNTATMVVHPSRYEGFGLPVVEAMRCGAPVITTTTSSLPEVGGNAAVLIDPDDMQGFADAIEALFSDRALRDDLAERGTAHAHTFDPEQLGRSTLNSYRAAVEQAQVPGEQKPHLALWTPLPPQKSGIADYSAEMLLEPLAQIYDLEVFVADGYMPDSELLHRYTIHHYSAFERRQLQRPFEAAVYQMGASFFHMYMVDAIKRYPGIVVLHDLTWSFALYARYAQAGDMAGFTHALGALEGSAAKNQFEQMQRTAGADYQHKLEQFLSSHYMLRDIVTKSRAVVVHSPLFKEELDAQYPGTRIEAMFLGMEDPWESAVARNTQLIRDQIGLASSTFVIGVFGIVDPVKRIDACIEALKQLQATTPDICLLIVGEQLSPAYTTQLKELVLDLGLESRIVFADYVTKVDFSAMMQACDVVVNLRYPSRKQMSASLMRAVAAGKPIIITDLPEWDVFPASFCLRVAPDEHEVETLATHLIELATKSQLLAQMSKSARDFYEHVGTSTHIVDSYRAIIDSVHGLDSTQPQRNYSSTDALLRTNKLCAVEDFTHPLLRATLHELTQIAGRTNPPGPSNPRWVEVWGAAMGVHALRQSGALHPEAQILAVGAATDATAYVLSNEARQVFATDVYLNPQAWQGSAPEFMLVTPEQAAPFEFQRARLVVQHMDGRVLHFPDNTFDGAICNSVIEHYNNLNHIANAAYELGRVLKPGGMLSLSTAYQLAGPPGGNGWDSHTLLTADAIQRFIVEASGLELVEPLDTSISPVTRTERRDLTLALNYHEQASSLGSFGRAGEPTRPKNAHVVQIYHGYAFCPVHLTLRKSAHYPATANMWAKPDMTTHAAIESTRSLRRPQTQRQLLVQYGIQHGHMIQQPIVAAMEKRMDSRDIEAQARLRVQLEAWNKLRLRGWYNQTLRRLPQPLAQFGRTILRVATLGKTFEAQAQLYHSMIDAVTLLANQLVQIDMQNQQTSLQSQASTDRQTRLEIQIGELRGQLAALEGIIDAGWQTHIERQLSTLHEQIDRYALKDDVLNAYTREGELSSRVDSLTLQLRTTDERSRQSIGYVRLLQQQAEINGHKTGTVRPSAATPVSGEELVNLVQKIEQSHPELAQKHSVEVSIQAEQAELSLVALTNYFGARMSSAPETYRAPNDAWYHIDFTPDWKRPVLFASAVSRLTSDGIFVLVTDSTHTDILQPSGLTHIADTIIAVDTGKQVRVLLWKPEV